MSRIKNDPTHLFTLHAHLSGGFVTIHAWDANVIGEVTWHQRIDAELWFHPRGQARTCVFPRGATWCAVNRWTSLDGNAARELVMSLFAMKPGDSYTPEQRAWAEANGEELNIEREYRFCDEKGRVKS